MADHKRFRFILPVLLLLALLLAAVPPVALAEGETVFTLRIIHTNDHHAHLEPVKVGDVSLSGVSPRKVLFDQIRKQGGNQLFLDAGDIFQGTLFFTQFNGKADLYFYNLLKYDAVTFGNHEFDKEPALLGDFLKEATFPIVSANVVADPASPIAGKYKPWVVKQVGGQKIGIFGLTAEDTSILSNPGPGITFGQANETAVKAIQELQAQGVNKIIALTHIGFDADQKLAREVARIDVIVGGHSHTPLGEMPGAKDPYPVIEKGPDGKTVVIVTDWEWGKWLGDITVGFDATGSVVSWQGAPVPVDGKAGADAAFDAKVKEYAADLDKLRKTNIGKTTVDLDGNRENVRLSETNLGNLIADAMRLRGERDGVVISIANGGGIRTSIPAGDVTMGQLLEVLPFANTVVLTDLTGVQILAALENGVSKVETGEGRFPQVSGMRFKWDAWRPAGSRIVNVDVLGPDGYQPMDFEATYRIATLDFMVGGGDGYTALTTGANTVDTGWLLSEIVSDYIKAGSPVSPEVEGRIEKIGE